MSSAASVTVSEGGSEDVRVARSLVDGPDRKPLVFVTLSSPPQKWHLLPHLDLEPVTSWNPVTCCCVTSYPKLGGYK